MEAVDWLMSCYACGEYWIASNRSEHCPNQCISTATMAIDHPNEYIVGIRSVPAGSRILGGASAPHRSMLGLVTKDQDDFPVDTPSSLL